MKYYSYNDFDGISNQVSILSEKKILDSYYEFWYGAMCKKFDKDVVDRNYSPQDCIDDWVVTNWAWRSD